MNPVRRILFIAPYPFDEAPSQRFRFEQFFPILESEGFECVLKPFWNHIGWGVLYEKGKYFHKAFFLFLGILNRYALLFSLHRYQFIFIHREFSPIGYPLVLRILAICCKKKLIYDFDDAIWIPNVSDNNRWFGFLKMYGNTERLIRWSNRVSCGNYYLKNYASGFNENTYYIPTTLDMQHRHNRVRVPNSSLFVLGWTGTHSTIRYLQALIPVIEKFSSKYAHFRFYVISDQIPDFSLPSMKFIPWNKSSEIEDLLQFTIGVMPLLHDPWSEGKCGFKALQYLSLGIPALVSPVGVNSHIVQHGLNGFLCHTSEEWESCIDRLIKDRQLLDEMSANCRQSIEQEFSTQAVASNFLSLFN